MLNYIQQHEQDCDALESEVRNILTALDIAITLGMGQQLIQSVATIAPFMRMRGHYAQINHYLQAALKAAMALNDAIGQITLLRHLANLAELQGDYSFWQGCQWVLEAFGREELAFWQGRQWALEQQLGNGDFEVREDFWTRQAKDWLHALAKKKDMSDETPSVES
jgi:hypothetical protein